MEFAKKYYYLLTGFIVFIVYLFTIAPSVIQIDSGELASVQATLGIAHPTGYPLFTIIGYIFSLIPLPFTKIFQLNLLAAIYCSAGISVFVYTAKLVLDNLTFFSFTKIKLQKKTKNKKRSERDAKNKNESAPVLTETVKFIAAIGGGLILAFSETYWFQSTSVEVYSLHLLLINFIILFLVKAYLANTRGDDKSNLKLWLIFAAFIALGFTNHMTTLLIIPGVAYLFFVKYKFSRATLKKILLMLGVFFPLLILIYLYLPIRASQQPLLNWGNPVDFETIFRHISGKQYQVWLFGSSAAAKRQLFQFIEALPTSIYFSLILSIAGIFVSYVYSKRFFIFLVISFLFTVLYSINYDIHDIDSYFLLAHISLAFFAVFGIVKLFNITMNKILVPVSITIVIIAIQLFFNFSKVNQSGIYTYCDYTRAILNSCSQESIIFSYQWDYFISQSYYFSYVEDFRKDVAVIDKELLRRSWYFDQLNRNYPYLFENMQDDVTRFREALLPFERSESFNANLLESLYRKLMTDLVANNIDEKDYYIAPEVFEGEMQRGEFVLPPGYNLVPDVLLFKVVKDNDYIPANDPEFVIRFSERRNYYINMIEKFIGTMLTRRAMYEIKHGKVDRARVFLKKIKDDLPTYEIPPTLKMAMPDI
jgi:hypothetical protein